MTDEQEKPARSPWWRRAAWTLLTLLAVGGCGAAVLAWYLPEIGDWVAHRQLAELDLGDIGFELLALRPNRVVLANLSLPGAGAPSARRVDVAFTPGSLRAHELTGIDVHGLEVTVVRDGDTWRVPGLDALLAKLPKSDDGEPWNWRYLRLHRAHLVLRSGDRQAALPFELEIRPTADGGFAATLTLAEAKVVQATYNPNGGNGTVELKEPLDLGIVGPLGRLFVPDGWRLDGLRGTLAGPLVVTLADNRPARVTGRPEWTDAALDGVAPDLGAVHLTAARLGGNLDIQWPAGKMTLAARPSVRDLRLDAPEAFAGRLAATNVDLQIDETLTIRNLTSHLLFGTVPAIELSVRELVPGAERVVATGVRVAGPAALGHWRPVLTFDHAELAGSRLTARNLAFGFAGLALRSQTLVLAPGDRLQVDGGAVLDAPQAGLDARVQATVQGGEAPTHEFVVDLAGLRAGPWRLDPQDLRLTVTPAAMTLRAKRLTATGTTVALTELALGVAAADDWAVTARTGIEVGKEPVWHGGFDGRAAVDGGHLRLTGEALPIGTPSLDLSYANTANDRSLTATAALVDGGWKSARTQASWDRVAAELAIAGGHATGKVTVANLAAAGGGVQVRDAGVDLPFTWAGSLQPSEGHLRGQVDLGKELTLQPFDWRVQIGPDGIALRTDVAETGNVIRLGLDPQVTWAPAAASLGWRVSVPDIAAALGLAGRLGATVPEGLTVAGGVELSGSARIDRAAVDVQAHLAVDHPRFARGDVQVAGDRVAVDFKTLRLPLTVAALRQPLAAVLVDGNCTVAGLSVNAAGARVDKLRLELPFFWNGGFKDRSGVLAAAGVHALGLDIRPFEWAIHLEPDSAWLEVDVTVDDPQMTLHLTPTFTWSEWRLELPAEIEALPLADLLTIARKVSPAVPAALSVAGNLRLEGQVVWRLKQVLARRARKTPGPSPWWHPELGESAVTAIIESGSANWLNGQVTVNGLEGSLTLTRFLPLRSAMHQQFTFAGGAFSGIPVDGGKFALTLENTQTIFLEGVTLSWCGGRLETHAVRFDPADPNYTIILYADGVDAAKVFALQDSLRGEVKGTLYGRIPITIAGSDLRFTEGFLFSAPGEKGTLKLKDAQVLADAAGDRDPRLKLASRALKNLEYNYVALRIDGAPDGFTKLRVDLLGRSATEKELPPVDLTVEMEAPINQLIKYGTSVNKLKKKLIE